MVADKSFCVLLKITSSYRLQVITYRMEEKSMSIELDKAVNSCETEGCCGGPASEGVDACCVSDADAKASGDDGCGCGTAKAEPAKSSCC